MIRITENLTLRRVAGQLAVSIGPIEERLTLEQAKDAAEAFAVVACMMEAADQPEELEEAA